MKKGAGSAIVNVRIPEGSHSGLVRAPAKRLSWETGIVGSNPTPSATSFSANVLRCPVKAVFLFEESSPGPLFFPQSTVKARSRCGNTVGIEGKLPNLPHFRPKQSTNPGGTAMGIGLYLNVAAAGSKSWVRRIVIEGKRRDIGLGSFPTVSLAQARNLAAANRATVAEGRNPLAEKRETRVAPPGHPGGTAWTPQFLPKLGGGVPRYALGRCPRRPWRAT